MSELSKQPKVHVERFLYLREFFMAIILDPVMFSLLLLQLHGAGTGGFEKLYLKYLADLDECISLQ